MDAFLRLVSQAVITLPLLELCILILVISVCLVFRLSRFGLITAYLFVYRWGLLFFLRQAQHMLLPYLILGFGVGIATIVGALWKPSEE